MRDVRVFGLLIGIELETRTLAAAGGFASGSPRSTCSACSATQHFPVFAGFCQYEPNVLKITPPLDASPDEIRQACATIIDVLKRPLPRVLAAVLGGLINPSSIPEKKP